MGEVQKFSFREQWQFLARDRKPVIWLLVVVSLILLIFTFTRVRNSTNTRSRLITVERLVEKGTLAHYNENDTTPFRLSKDAIVIDGNMYSSKPPNYPYLMAGESWLMKQLTGQDFYIAKKDYIRMLTLVNQVFPYIIMLVLAVVMASWYYRDQWTLLMFALCMSVGLLPFAYSVTINNHAVAAVCFFISFYLLWLLYFQQRTSPWIFLLLGLLAGYGASIDLPGYSFAAFAAVGAFIKHPAKAMLTLAGIALPFLTTMGTYYELTGQFKPIYMQGDLYYFEGSYWHEREGFDALQESKWTYLFNITFGHHGLFSISPVLLIGALGLGSILKKRQWELWPYFAAIAICILAIFTFVWLRTSNYGGYCIGMRWFVLFMPLLMFAGLPAIRWLGEKWWRKGLMVLLLILSMPAVAQALYHEAFYRSYLDQWLITF